MEGSFFSKYKGVLFLALLLAMVVGLYWKTLPYDLVYDSKIYFRDNPLFLEDHPMGAALFSAYSGKMGTEDKGHYYRPFATLTFLLEKKVWGLYGSSLRAVNLALFCLTIVCLFFLFRVQGAGGWFAYTGTALSALFPLNLDNVVWVVGRSDLFLVLWGVLALLFLDTYLKRGKPSFLILSCLFYGLAIFSKESALFLLPILALYEWVKNKKIRPLYYTINAAVTALFFVCKSLVLGSAFFTFTLFSGVWQNVKVLLGTVGFYFKCLFFPFDYDVYIPIDSTITTTNIVLGVIFLLLLVGLFIFALKKEKILLIPLSFIVVFLFGQLPLVFFDTLVFRASSRFMILPAIGLVWMLCYLLARLKPLIKGMAAAALLLSFIPAVIANGTNYRDEVAYWTKLSESFPENGYTRFQLADALFSRRDFRASFVLDEALQKRPRFSTFVHMCLLYAEIEFERGRYPQTLAWLDRLQGVASRKIQMEAALRRAKVFLVQGEIARVEQILAAAIKGQDEERYRQILWQVYTGFERWQEAERIEKTAGETAKMKAGLAGAEREQKLAFFLEYHNYGRAIEILLTFPASVQRDLSLARLYYLHGKAQQAEAIIAARLANEGENVKLLNTIGYFYLKEMMRANEALPFFKRSLEKNRNQPRLAALVSYLEQHTKR